MIEIKNLDVSYRDRGKESKVLQNVNLQVGKGEICALIGPSGVGKSTLLKVLAGIIKDYKGEVLIHGKKIDPVIQRIGFIPQNYGLVRWKTIEENIFLSAKIKDGEKNIDIDYYQLLLNKLKLKDVKKRYPHQLSGGQKQRVSIARAFLLKPDLLLMDESFSALDDVTREKVHELFLEVWKENRVTTILVTHDISEAIYLGKKIAVLSEQCDKTIEVIENPMFGELQAGLNEEFFNMNRKLREYLKGMDINET